MRLGSCRSRKLALLAPRGATAPRFFRQVQENAIHSHHLLAGLQRLRGSVYLTDGAIGAAELTDGRHDVPIDHSGWHLLVVDEDERVCGCVRYRERASGATFSKLGVSSSPLAQCNIWGPRLRAAVRSELALSRELGLPYVEVGGWALNEEIRRTT